MQVDLLGQPTPEPKLSARALVETLTSREREVVRAMADGLSGAETADRLNISRRTVDVHRSNIFLKLDVSSCLEVMRIVVAARLALLLPFADWMSLLR